MRVVVIGARGFVGSAFVRFLSGREDVELVPVAREDYARLSGTASEVVIDAACNSRKYLADERPFDEFDLSVTHRLRTLRDFPAGLHVHISSVDVYHDLASPEATLEESPIDLARCSHYGFHKLMAEQLVRHHAGRWLIVRLAGMVGPGLRKNPVYDVVHGKPLRIHPDSQYQFMSTEDVGIAVWRLVGRGAVNDVFNVCGNGLISPREVAALARRDLDLSLLDPGSRPRIVDVAIEKISRIASMPETRRTIAEFLGSNER